MEKIIIKELQKQNLELTKLNRRYKEKLHIAIQALNELQIHPDRRVAARCIEYIANQDS
tara:strand:- start:1177 stop:1353 length:177 start_codon:yes stop_codon:yes gene_type:complete